MKIETNETPIIILVKEIQRESNRALDNYKLMNDSQGKTKITATTDYVMAVRQIGVLYRAVEKLNEV